MSITPQVDARSLCSAFFLLPSPAPSGLEPTALCNSIIDRTPLAHGTMLRDDRVVT